MKRHIKLTRYADGTSIVISKKDINSANYSIGDKCTNLFYGNYLEKATEFPDEIYDMLEENKNIKEHHLRSHKRCINNLFSIT